VFDVLVERYDTLAKNKNILFETDIDLSIGSVYLGDQIKFFKVFDFLLSNSISYTDKGHIILSISVDNAASSISNYQRLNVSIEDTGINLTKQEAGDLFDPYSAAMFNSSRKSGGSGIRLSTAARLIDMMDGEIEIEYKNGSGLTFNFYLYLENADHGQIPISVDSLSDKKDDNKHLNLQKLNVLVVEDNKTNSTLLTWVLEDLGHEVMVAENGIECLNSLENNEFDIIFMDQHMPGMDGEEATRKIRARSDHKANIAIVGCTADAFQETRDSLIEAGQNDIILKPISDDLIFDVTQKFLNGDYDIKTETENVHDDK
jgi:CheY-like chemotaxis protein